MTADYRIDLTSFDHLFISYASEDEEFAKWLTLKLTTEGYKVWCDKFKLLGGESYPRDIDVALKTQTFRVIAVLSKYSLKKENPIKERTLAHNISRQRKVDFIIPVLIDNTSSDELDWMDSDLTYISFNNNWATGLVQLIKKLHSINAPNLLSDGSKLVSDWIAEQSRVVDTRERLWTNLFEIVGLPDFINRMETSVGYEIHDQGWIFHQQSENVFWSFDVPNEDLQYTKVKWNDSARTPYGVPPIDIASILIKEHIRRLLLQRKAEQTPDGIFFLSNETIPNGWLPFIDYRSKRTRLLVTSVRSVKSTGTTRKYYRYHLAPVFQPILRKYEIPVLDLQVHLYLTDTASVPLPPGIVNRRRKRIAKTWWNYQWMSRVFALGQWAFDGQTTFNLAVGRSYEIIVCGEPVSVAVPVGINENTAILSEITPDVDDIEDDAADSEWDDGQP